ncbi:MULTISPECIES: YfbU family protein [Rhizobium]|uniref:YfbU family protein n=1 Tax=Rhizobium TaxID=379 RepID=UPI0019585708|nr:MULTISPECIES: YfbU family protein [Rhizobium]MBM7049609.1 YfbU family protein [Rhizobium lusitanum]
MRLSQGEKLILMALAAAKDGKDELDLDFIRRAIYSGNTWALTWEFSGIPAEDTEPGIADETAEIMSMWSYIERSVGELPVAEREQLEKDAYPHSLSFSGFDGNHDPHYSVASFLVKDMGRFEEFKERSLNSHTQSSLPTYRRMLSAYKAELRNLGFTSRSLPADKILGIVKP